MAQIKYLKGPCQACGGSIQYPAELVGTPTTCPHCGANTELVLATPPVEGGVPRRTIVWTSVAVVVLIAGLIGAFLALKRAERLAERRKPAATATNSPTPAPAH